MRYARISLVMNTEESLIFIQRQHSETMCSGVELLNSMQELKTDEVQRKTVRSVTMFQGCSSLIDADVV